ncbi:unnamed protein product [Oikopleura dioica]|uniref:Uncharacterized protein n=1 Tax=Oikopleura dioica TaxID=34765 RepID=E4WZD2_OIKDI|nr:unnamed protein product [Oikopleura dioica]
MKMTLIISNYNEPHDTQLRGLEHTYSIRRDTGSIGGILPNLRSNKSRNRLKKIGMRSSSSLAGAIKIRLSSPFDLRITMPSIKPWKSITIFPTALLSRLWQFRKLLIV